MSDQRSTFLSNIPPVVRNLIIINFICWLASLMLPRILQNTIPGFDLNDFLGMHYWASDKFNFMQMFTYMFMHGSFDHIFFNMFAIFMFGPVLEQRWGSQRFFTFYLVAGIGAALTQQLIWTIEYQSVLSALDEAIAANSAQGLLPYEGRLRQLLSFSNLLAFDTPALIHMKTLLADAPLTIGASGAVFGLLLAFGWLFPDAKMMLLFLPIPIPSRIFVGLYAVVELFLGVAGFSGDNVAHFAHLGGMLFGWLLILYWKKRKQLY